MVPLLIFYQIEQAIFKNILNNVFFILKFSYSETKPVPTPAIIFCSDNLNHIPVCSHSRSIHPSIMT